MDGAEPSNRARSQEIVEEHARGGTTILSTQVLQELYYNSTRRLQRTLTSEDVEAMIKKFSEISALVQVDVANILSAISRTRAMSVSFWDALIFESALSGGATTLFTEDLNHGQQIDGPRIENPFI